MASDVAPKFGANFRAGRGWEGGGGGEGEDLM